MKHTHIADGKKYIFLISSTRGHLLPAVRLAHLLQKRGQDVLFVSSDENKVILDSYGIKCVSFSGQTSPFLSTYDWYVGETGSIQYQLIRQVLEVYKPDAIVASQLVMPAFALAEVYSLPLIVIGYCEFLFPGIGDECSSKQWRIESITRHYNSLRTLLGLPLIESKTKNSPLVGDRYLLRSVPEFTVQAGLPPQVQYVGSLLWHHEYINYDLKRFVERYTARSEPLVFVQIGRLFRDRKVWTSLVDVLGRLGAGFILDISRSDYLKEHSDFPENFFLHPYIPLEYCRDDVLGVICGGQTTSVLSALVCGKPVLGIPNSADGAEVTHRIVENGTGCGILYNQEISEEVVASYLEKSSQGYYSEKLAYYQEHFLRYEKDDFLYERCFSWN